jgi:hypothetical protein
VNERLNAQLDDAHRRAVQANLLLDNPLLRDAFKALSNSYLSVFENSEPEASAQREAAYYRLRALHELRADLESVVNGGRVLAHNARGAIRKTTLKKPT